MVFNKAQRDQIIMESKGKTIEDVEYDELDNYWTFTFTDGEEMSFRFMAELTN